MNPPLKASGTSRSVTRRRHFCILVLALSAAALVQADEVTVDARDFIPVFDGTVYAESSAGNLTCTGGNGNQLFVAQLPLPPTPVELDLKQLAIWGGDFASLNAEVDLVRYCQSEFSASLPVRTNIAEVSSSGNGGNYFDSVAMNRRVDDQQTCIYLLQAQIGLDGCAGGNLSIARVRVRYDLVQQPVIDAMFSNSFEN